MRIGEESYIIQDKINTFNLSLYIKKKLGLDKSSYNNSSFIFKEKNKNKSFTNINLNLDISTKIEANNKTKKYSTCIIFSKNCFALI